jgi:hypothetical protein
MPIGEEEARRRCIIDPSTCQEGLTQESALAQELMRYDSAPPDEVDAQDEAGYRQMARGLLRDFTFADRHAGKPPSEGL